MAAQGEEPRRPRHPWPPPPPRRMDCRTGLRHQRHHSIFFPPLRKHRMGMMRDALAATKLVRNRARMLSGILVGLGCLALLILALGSYLYGPALYHLFRLQREPGYLAKLLDDPRGGEVRMQAVRWFIQSEQGKQALFRLYAWDAIATVLDANRGPPEDLKSGVIWIDAMAWGFVVKSSARTGSWATRSSGAPRSRGHSSRGKRS